MENKKPLQAAAQTLTWQQRIGAAFGIEDCVFAMHPSDAEHAKELIAEALSAGASREDFLKEMVGHVYRKVGNPGHRETLFEAQRKNCKISGSE